MTVDRTPRLAITLSPGERDALRQFAHETAEPEARAAARLLRAALADYRGRPLDAPSPRRRGPQRRSVSATADWLPATKRLFEIEALRARYPHELRYLSADPLAEQAIAEPLAALSVWRERLDSGDGDDPRAELAFAEALLGVADRLEHRTREGR